MEVGVATDLLRVLNGEEPLNPVNNPLWCEKIGRRG